VYLAELARVCELNLHAANAPRVSGRLLERVRQCDIHLLTPKELSYRVILSPNPQAGYQKANLLTNERKQQLVAAYTLGQIGGLGAYDGVISQGESLFERENKRGFSPSALQELGACPMKYYFHHALQLGEPEEPASRQGLAANVQGTAYHEILNEFYQELVKKGWLKNLFDQGVAQVMHQTIDRHYNQSSYRIFGIYPVIWEIILENMHQKLCDFAVNDVKELGNFVPRYFEQEVITEETDAMPMRLRGFIDRMDVDEDNKQFRIADYKSTRKGTTNLAKDFFTRLVFQPVMYILMAQHVKIWKDYKTAGSCLLSIEPYSKRDLSAEQYAAIAPRAISFLVQLTDFVKTGQFFICPGEVCTYCPYKLLCRKDAFKPLLRAQRSALYKSLEEAKHYDA
jgi:ATP-dependent helicase/nuclease subunit B